MSHSLPRTIGSFCSLAVRDVWQREQTIQDRIWKASRSQQRSKLCSGFTSFLLFIFIFSGSAAVFSFKCQHGHKRKWESRPKVKQSFVLDTMMVRTFNILFYSNQLYYVAAFLCNLAHNASKFSNLL